MIRVGCCGFSRFPARGDKLANYAGVFKLAEVNQTFYRLPRPSTAEKWRKKVPEDFEFTVKLNKLVTHEKPFSLEDEVVKTYEKTIEICKILRAKVLLIQTPASFRATSENIKKLEEFLKSVKTPGSITLAWEPRGKTWGKSLIRDLCRKLGLVHCVDPLKEEPTTEGPVWYFRLHGLGKRMYVYKYADEDLRRLKLTVEKLKGEVYILFNNYAMYEDAKRFKTYLEKGVLPQTAWGFKAVLTLIKDLEYPLTKEELLERRGNWRFFWSPTEYKRLRDVLLGIPDKTYHSAEEVVEKVKERLEGIR